MGSTDGKAEAWRNKIFKSLQQPLALLDLFEFLPQVYMNAKDCEGRYLRANRVVLRVVGVDTETEMLGRTDFDFFPPAIASQYVAEDRRVIEAAVPLTDQVWLVPDNKGVPQIYVCNKIPLFNRRGEVIGIAGVKRPFEQTATASGGHERLLKVLQFVSTHFGDEIAVSDLAEHANLSVSQLHREFARRFNITPNRYIREVRIGVARHLLESGQQPLSQIAADCGFYDQSHFSRQFKSSTGISPLEYRKRFCV